MKRIITINSIFSVLILSSLALDYDYKNDFNKALKEAIILLKAAQNEKTHSKITFYPSYKYAQIDNKELSESYSQL